jgi:hypothetical protein
MNRILPILLLAVCTAFPCVAQQKSTVTEPVRYEDGTAVTGEAEAEGLFAQDTFRADTTITEGGDTLIVLKHTSAYVRMKLDGLPADAGFDRVLLVPMEGEVTELPVTLTPTGERVIWMTKRPGILPAAAAVAQTKGGRTWSVRLPARDMQPGIAYRWTGTCLTSDAPDAGLTATPLPQTSLDIDSGEYSGIAWIQGNRYAVVSDNLKGGGIVHFSVPVDAGGGVGLVRMQPADGTRAAAGRARDNEGIAYVPSTGTLYVSTEMQEIREYDLAGRETGKALRIPNDLGAEHIQPNRGFEALSYNDSTGLFWSTTESPLKQDTFLPRLHRLQSFNTDGTPAERFLYQTDAPIQTAADAAAYVHGIPAVSALDDGRLLVLEREVYVPKGGFWDKLTNSFTKTDLYLVDPVHDTAGILRKTLLCSFTTGALDLANYEGMCLGPVLPDGQRTLLLIADSQNGAGGLTGEYVKVILLR